MAIPTFQLRCIANTLVARNVYELRIEKPNGFAFVPGQFVLFKVPLKDNPEAVQPRAYSIASDPEEVDLRFIIKLVPNGRASRWIKEDVREGYVVETQGPFGRFTLKEEDLPLLFVATGTGVAPFRSQLRWLLRGKNDERPIQLITGVLSPDQFFWADEWQALEREHAALRVSASFLSGEADWHGETGSVQERVNRFLSAYPSSIGVYVCGAPDMVQSVKELCASRGVAPQNIRTERYI